MNAGTPPSQPASSSPDAPGQAASRGRLGTFAGVFTPSILTILGIILFLRLGYVVGGAGLGRALLILGLANLISVLTSVSLAVVATNLRVKGGGDYYLISRTLGVEYGGALGLVLFLAQSVSVAFYALGFGEALAEVLGTGPAWLGQAIAAGAVLLLFVLAWFGADVATRFQFVVMAVLAAGLVGFFLGGVPEMSAERLRENWTASGDLPFWLLFAIFFPAVTGFTQGVSMSGDLKDPSRSLPLGTFSAVGLSVVIYFAVALVFAATVPGRDLVADYGAMRRVSILPWLVDGGVIAATLSSALASFLGAPRILQSLARDRVFPWLSPFARGHGPAANPRRGVLLSLTIALVTVALGNLNLIAPVVSMFFLVSYGLLNYATWFEARARSPSFRPTFRFYHPHLGLLGFLACLAAMLAINPAAGAVAVAVLFGIQQYVKRTAVTARWADSDHAYHFQRIRERLLALSAEPEHPRDWRPVILAFSRDPDRRARTLRFAAWIEGGSGITTAVRLLEGEGAVVRKEREEVEARLRADLARRGLPVHARVVSARDLTEALPVLIQAHGLGPIRANTVLLNWFDHAPGPEAPPGLSAYGRILRLALRFRCHVAILGVSTESFAAVDALEPEARRIHVWYPDDTHGPLMLLFAYLMTRNHEWEHASLHVFAPVPEGEDPDTVLEGLRVRLADARIPAEPEVVPSWDTAAVRERSAGAAAVFLPFRLDGETPESVFGGSLNELMGESRITVLVRAAEPVDLDAEPEAGPFQEIVSAEDAAEDAAARARAAEKAAGRAARAAEKAAERIEKTITDENQDRDHLLAAAGEAREAQSEAEKARRRALKARVKAEDAARHAEEVSGEAAPDTGDTEEHEGADEPPGQTGPDRA